MKWFIVRLVLGAMVAAALAVLVQGGLPWRQDSFDDRIARIERELRR